MDVSNEVSDAGGGAERGSAPAALVVRGEDAGCRRGRRSWVQCLGSRPRHDISRQNIYQWRRELKLRAIGLTGKAVFLPVEMTQDEPGCGVKRREDAPNRRVEIGLRNGRTLRVATDIPDTVLARLIRVAEVT